MISPELSAIHIAQDYPRARDYKRVVIGRPKKISQEFHWATHLISNRDINEKLKTFVKNTPFPLDGSTLSNICFNSFEFCTKVYEQILFPEKENRLIYHNLEHALITSITAQKMFLGGLVKAEREGKLSKLSKKQLIYLQNLITLTSCFHEINDWWSLPYPNSHDLHNPHLEQAKQLLLDRLTALGISSHDFNRLLRLNVLGESPEDSLEAGKNMKLQEGFLADNGVHSLLDQLSGGDDRNTIFSIASDALCSADFLQVINPAYLQLAVVQYAKKGSSLQTHMGPAVLAIEMDKWSEEDLLKARFGKKKGDHTEITWPTVKLSIKFFGDVAEPRIQLGLNALDIFSHEEYTNVMKVLKSKSDVLMMANATPLKKNPPTILR